MDGENDHGSSPVRAAPSASVNERAAPSSVDSTAPLSTPMSTPLRRSMRYNTDADGSTATDEDSLVKAMRRKAEHNLDTSGMVKNPKYFLTFSDCSISAKLNSVGVSLGNTGDKVTFSTNALRHLEYDRFTVTLKRSAKSLTSHEDEEELNDTIDVQLLSHLVGDVSEGGLDEAMLSSLCDLSIRPKI